MGEPVQPWTPPDEAALAILRYTSLDVWRTSTDILGRSSLENTLRHPNIPILKVEIPPEDAAKTAYKSPSRWTNVKEMFSSSPKTPDRDSPNIQAEEGFAQRFSNLQELPADNLVFELDASPIRPASVQSGHQARSEPATQGHSRSASCPTDANPRRINDFQT